MGLPSASQSVTPPSAEPGHSTQVPLATRWLRHWLDGWVGSRRRQRAVEGVSAGRPAAPSCTPRACPAKHRAAARISLPGTHYPPRHSLHLVASPSLRTVGRQGGQNGEFALQTRGGGEHAPFGCSCTPRLPCPALRSSLRPPDSPPPPFTPSPVVAGGGALGAGAVDQAVEAVAVEAGAGGRAVGAGVAAGLAPPLGSKQAGAGAAAAGGVAAAGGRRAGRGRAR